MPTFKMILAWLLACAIGILIGGAAMVVVISNRGIHIQAFSPDKPEVLIGDKVTFTWNTTGATEVAFRFVHLPTGSNGDLWEWVHTDVSAGGLPPTGQWSYEVPPNLIDTRFRFEIEAADAVGNKLAARSEEISVKYRPCFDGTSECATPPTTTHAVIQAFEHGYMLLREDTQTVYAMTRDLVSGRQHVIIGWEAFKDAWADGGNFALEGQPPDGLQQPARRFINIMAVYGLQGDLGWATAAETTFEATIQQTRIACSSSCSPMLLIKLDDGRVLQLAASDEALQRGHIWNIVAAAQ